VSVEARGMSFEARGVSRGDAGAPVRVRYFAGAAEAAGCEEETLRVGPAAGPPSAARPQGPTVADLRAAMLAAHGPGLARVLPRCALLVAGVRAGEEDPVPAGVVIDVLPPFAGG
jgi:molybdopterin converting factor small subunit